MLGEDDEVEKFVEINKILPDGKKWNDVTRGKYDVVVSTGPAYATRRQEAAENLMKLSENPVIAQVGADILVRALDIPMADKLADRLKLMLPPGLDEDVDKERQEKEQQGQGQPKQPSPEEMQMQAEQQAAMAKMQLDAQSAQQKLQIQQQDSQAKIQLAQMEAQADHQAVRVRDAFGAEEGRTGRNARQPRREDQGSHRCPYGRPRREEGQPQSR
jgi:hypothetical protein